MDFWNSKQLKVILIPVFILNLFGQIYLYILEALPQTQQSGNKPPFFFFFCFSNVCDIPTLSQAIFFSSLCLSFFSIASNLHFLLTGTALRVLMANCFCNHNLNPSGDRDWLQA